MSTDQPRVGDTVHVEYDALFLGAGPSVRLGEGWSAVSIDGGISETWAPDGAVTVTRRTPCIGDPVPDDLHTLPLGTVAWRSGREPVFLVVSEDGVRRWRVPSDDCTAYKLDPVWVIAYLPEVTA